MKRLNRILTLTHRWSGVVMCLFLAMWFISGMVMVFIPFPRLPAQDRLHHVPPVDGAQVKISPARAMAAADISHPSRIRLWSGPSGPLYLVEPDSGPNVAVQAVDGRLFPAISSTIARQMAERATDSPSQSVEGPFDVDLWVVHPRYDSRRPYYRVSMQDDAGSDIYVSATSGEIVQRTDRQSRIANFAGSVSHWLYIIPLRRNTALWNDVLWWLSWAGLAMIGSGVALGVWRSAKSLQKPGSAGRRRISVFRGLHRWHHLSGLLVGLLALTWMGSGLLAVDRGRIFPTGQPDHHHVAAFRGMELSQAARQIHAEDWARLAPFAEGEMVPLAGQVWLIGRQGDPVRQQIIQPSHPERPPMATFSAQHLTQAVRMAWPDVPLRSVDPIESGDFYAHLMAVSRMPPDHLWRVTLDDPGESWLHLDAANGRITSVMDSQRRLQRWLYAGLHTFDLPGLRLSQSLRMGVEMLALLAGSILSLSGVVLGVRRLRLFSARQKPRFGMAKGKS